MELQNLLYEKRAGVAYVTVNRPKVLNALDRKTLTELRLVFEDVRDDSAVRGAILTGAGDKAFIAGADIREIGGADAVAAAALTRNGQGVLDLIENLGK